MQNKYCYNLGLLFYQVAAAHPNHIAIKYPSGESYTYLQLNHFSNQTANYLLSKSIKPGDVVGILNNKSFGAYSLMIACLKIGAIYTNFDITSPWLRILKILSNCQPKIIFNDHDNHLLIDGIKTHYNTNIIDLFSEPFRKDLAKLNNENLAEQSNHVNGNEPAYIMFTSGSTGFPKGALMSHSNVLNFINWGQQTFDVTTNDVFTNANPIYFDNSVFDFYISLFSGACLVPFSTDIVKNARILVNTVNETKCTIWFSVPSLIVYLLTTKSLQPTDFISLTRISFGGEGFPKPKLKQLYDLYGKRIKLYNVYGPTECTCICSSYVITEKDFENLNEFAPLGSHMAPNFGYEIIPIEEGNKNCGELCLTGPNVGLGYYNDVERTSKSFVQNPNKKFPQRMYKTGDIVEKRENGYIYFKGRADNQIKHMGFRIELEEIESVINSFTYVNETGVIYKKITPDLGQIIAFVSLNTKKDETEVIENLKKTLPPYMIPKKIIILDTLPKNKNGKIDRTQLAQLQNE